MLRDHKKVKTIIEFRNSIERILYSQMVLDYEFLMGGWDVAPSLCTKVTLEWCKLLGIF
jgi:hypothetical protein